MAAQMTAADWAVLASGTAAIAWVNWYFFLAKGGSAAATVSATGVQEVNDCLPYCAVGHFHGYRVDVIFWGDASLPGRPGSQRYTSVTLLYPGARPNVGAHQAPATVTLPLVAASS